MSARHISELLVVREGATVPCGDCGAEIPDPLPVEVFALKLCERCATARKVQARQRAQDEAERRRGEWLQVIGVPRRCWDIADFDAMDHTAAGRAARAYYESRGWVRGARSRALLLCGPTGTGKTVAASAIHAELLPDLHAAQRFMVASALARRLANFRDVDEAMDQATTIPLLTLDDVADLEPKALALLEEVLIVREAEGRPLVITSNLTPKRLAELFSDRVNDRLRAWGDVIECRGSSLRKRPETT